MDELKFLANADLLKNHRDSLEKAQTFLSNIVGKDQKVVLITSGGTTVPLEARTVRFIDNFSKGTRGAASAEYFLRLGYTVVFLHRRRTLVPFERKVPSNSFLRLLQQDGDVLTVKSEYAKQLLDPFEEWHRFKGSLHLIEFTSVVDYLFLLQGLCQHLQEFGSRVLLYLAAAVSDFYIPEEELPEHKLQSSNGPLQLLLKTVPKALGPLVSVWIPKAFVVSFKLETDETILETKAKAALLKYKHEVVIANRLESRKHEVWVFTGSSSESIKLSKQDIQEEAEIEKYIVENICEKHSVFIVS